MFQINLRCLVLDLSRFLDVFAGHFFLNFQSYLLSGEEDGYSDGKHAEAAAAEEEHRSRTKGGHLSQSSTIYSTLSPINMDIRYISFHVNPWKGDIKYQLKLHSWFYLKGIHCWNHCHYNTIKHNVNQFQGVTGNGGSPNYPPINLLGLQLPQSSLPTPDKDGKAPVPPFSGKVS